MIWPLILWLLIRIVLWCERRVREGRYVRVANCSGMSLSERPVLPSLPFDSGTTRRVTHAHATQVHAGTACGCSSNHFGFRGRSLLFVSHGNVVGRVAWLGVLVAGEQAGQAAS